MGDKKRQGQIIIDQPGMTSVVTKEYLVIPLTDTLINKKAFLIWTLVMFIGMQVLFGVVLGIEVIISFYWTLLMVYVNFNLTHWVVIPIQILFLTGVIGVLYLKHRKQVTVKELNRLAELRRQAYGGEIHDE